MEFAGFKFLNIVSFAMDDPIREMLKHKSDFYNYADLLYDRNILHKSSKVVEGCVGNTGWMASLQVAKHLGKEAEFYMVDCSEAELGYHKDMFLKYYEPSPELGRPKLEWVAGYIEEQEPLINCCDALLFHNYYPVDRLTLANVTRGARDRIKKLTVELVKFNPRHIVFFLPYVKEPDEFGVFLDEVLNESGHKSSKEVVDGIHYAGDLEVERIEEWKGKTIIVKLDV